MPASQYAIMPSVAWDRKANVADSKGCVLVGAGELSRRVNGYTNRPGVLAIPSVARKLRVIGGRAFIAAGRDGVDMIVERVR